MTSASQVDLERQVEAFACGTETEYAFPSTLTIEERKVVKNAAKKFGLESDSFGMGSERCIHIFKRGGSSSVALKPIVYSVKNTFVDEPVDPSQPSDNAVVAPSSQSMPAGAFQEHLSNEVAEVVSGCAADAFKESCEENLEKEPAVSNQSLIATAEDSAEVSSPRDSQCDTGSTIESDSHETNREISIKNSIKNTFLHFEETDAKENADPRIIQSMPNGKFAEAIQAERRAVADAVARPQALSENQDVEGVRFPSTPNGETSYKAFDQSTVGAAEGTPTVQWTPHAATQDTSVSVLPPAVWNPAASFPMTPIVECSPTAGMSMPAAPLPPQAPPSLLAPGTPVVVFGLVNQPAFNGLVGAVSAFDEKCSRYNIMLDIGGGQQRMVKLKGENLALSQPPQMPQAVQPQVQSQPPNYDMSGWQQATSAAKPALKLELMV